MPSNNINSENWTIDNFQQTQTFPLIVSADNYREFIFKQNLPGVNAEVSNRVHKATLDSRGNETNITTSRLTNPGDITNWIEEGGYEVGVHEVRDIGMLHAKNKYGPEFIEAYNCPELMPEATGFIQYGTSAEGDIRASLVGKQLGFGFGSGINFDSELSEIGKERRKTEAINRIKDNAAANTLGKINLDPFSLLAGNDLITKDFTITKGTGLGGQIFDFATDLIGFNIPTSIIPEGAFGQYGDIGYDKLGSSLSNDTIAYEALLKFTGAGQKSVLFSALKQNRYGPTLQDPNKSSNTGNGSGVSNVIKGIQNFTQKLGGPGDAPVLTKYTDNVDDKARLEQRDEGQKSLVDKVNEAVGKTIDGLKNAIVGDVPEWVSPSVVDDDLSKLSTFGFDDLASNNKPGDTWQYDDVIGTQMNPTETSTLDPKTFDNLMFWGANTDTRPNKFKRGLLKYTQELINSSINEPRAKARFIGAIDNKANFKNGSHKRYSKGNTVTVVLSGDTVYCRSWSTRKPYRQVSDLIRHRDLDKSPEVKSLSVLDSSGFVQIAPYKTLPLQLENSNGTTGLSLPKVALRKYMLSIENLAWQGTEHLLKLAPCEVGPNGGRIMWFPPYDINFTDNTSVNWDTTTFIGRGEPIYTYNNTERTGTLSFKIIVDHPSAFNKPDESGETLREKAEEVLFRYFAGCEDPIQEAELSIPAEDIEEIKLQEAEEEEPEIDLPPPQPRTPPVAETAGYFRNASNCLKVPDCGQGTDIKSEIDAGWDPNGKNAQFVSDITAMTDFLVTDDGKRYRIKIDGHTSAAAPSDFNDELSKVRANGTKDYILSILLDKDSETITACNLADCSKTYKTEKEQSSGNNSRWLVGGSGESGSKSKNDENFIASDNDPNTQEAIDDRRVNVSLEYNEQIDSDVLGQKEENPDATQTNAGSQVNGLDLLPEDDEITPGVITDRLKKEREEKEKARLKRLAKITASYIGWECSYFEKMEQNTPFIYDTLKDKLKYFHPAFHSMTPEGFNSRLTFLQQCTRQGPSIDKGGPFNMSFGKPPICVLRIGDFYHTKIVIDAVNLTFDPLQWDLNPEGIGVQPMLCNVDLNFKFIGGSSLGGPINELQNAVTFNFFANTALYNPLKIFKSVKEYKQTKSESKTKLPEETPNTDNTPKEDTGTRDTFNMGAYLYPSQADTKDADNSSVEPPKDTSAALNQKPNESTPITKEAGLSEETKAKIEEESTSNEATIDDDIKKISLGVVEFSQEDDLYFEMDVDGQLSKQYVIRPRVLDRTEDIEHVGFDSELFKTDSYFYLIDNGEFTPDIETHNPNNTYRLKVDLLYQGKVEKTYNANL